MVGGPADRTLRGHESDTDPNCLVDSIKKPAHSCWEPLTHRSTPTGPWAPTALHMPDPHPYTLPVANSLCVLLTMARVGFGGLPVSTHRKLAHL